MANPNRAQVVTHPSLQRDLSSNAIINTDSSSYHARMAQKKATQAQQDEVEELKDQVAELKKLVQKLSRAVAKSDSK